MSDPRLAQFDPADLPEGFPWEDAVVVCTDGSGNAKTGIGAWAFVVYSPPGAALDVYWDMDPVEGAYDRAAPAADTTNNLMEMQAVLEALRFVDPERPLVIVCDSQYVVHGAALYLPTWEATGWKKSDGKPVKNRAVWEAISAAQSLGDRHVHYHHVRGHKGHSGNERADKLCTRAVKEYLAAMPTASTLTPTT